MFRNRVISSVVAASLMAAVSGFAFAADTGAAAPAAAEAKPAALTKQQIADIRKECKEANKKDMKAFHKCVKEKEDAAKAGK
jgi:uncharacterized membrane protein